MKSAWVLASVVLGVAAAPGCTGGGDDDDDGTALTGGVYAVSNAVLEDRCFGGLPTESFYDGVDDADVLVSVTAIEIHGFGGAIGYDIDETSLLDNTFGTPVTTTFDFRDADGESYPLDSGIEYSCVVDYFTEYAGEIHTRHSFELIDTWTLTVTGGSECTAAVVTSAFDSDVVQALPCTKTDGAHFSLAD